MNKEYYELSLELKEAGFVQFGPSFGYKHTDDGRLYYAYFFDRVPEVKAPTLEELIEACGDELGDLTRGGVGWMTNAENVGYYPETSGKTPAEAVARLWLALNKK